MKIVKKLSAILGALFVGAAVFGSAQMVQAAGDFEMKASQTEIEAVKGSEFSVTYSYTAAEGKDISAWAVGLNDSWTEHLEQKEVTCSEGLKNYYKYNIGKGTHEFINIMGTLPDEGSVTVTFNVLADCTVKTEDIISANMEIAVAGTAGTTKQTVNSEVSYTHLESDKVTDRKEATCVTPGFVKVTCKTCQTLISEDTIAADGNHKWDQGTETVKASCTSEGTLLYKCTRDTACTATETKILDKLDHKLDNGTETKPATCKETGLKVYKCENCDHTEEKVLDKIAHTWAVADDTDADGWKVTKAATETEEGTKERTCKDCDHVETAKIAKLSATVTPGADDKDPNTDKDTTDKNTTDKNTTDKNTTDKNTTDKNTTDKKTETTDATKTGDNSLVGLYVVVMAAAAAVLGGVVVLKKKRFFR